MIVKFRKQPGQVLGVAAHVAVGVFVGPQLGRLALAGELLMRPDEWEELRAHLPSELLEWTPYATGVPPMIRFVVEK